MKKILMVLSIMVLSCAVMRATENLTPKQVPPRPLTDADVRPYCPGTLLAPTGGDCRSALYFANYTKYGSHFRSIGGFQGKETFQTVGVPAMSKVSFDRDRFAPGNIELAVTVSTPEYGVLWTNRVPLEEGTRGNVMERRQYFGLIETDDKQFKVFRMNNVYELPKTVEEARAIYDKLRK